MENIVKNQWRDVVAGGKASAAIGAAAGANAGFTAGVAAGVSASTAAGGSAACGAAVGGVAGAAAGAAAGGVAGAATSVGNAANAGNTAGIAAGTVAGHDAAVAACTPSNANDGGGGGGGGKVICTELCRNGAIEHEVWMADIRYSRQNFSERTMRGYHLWGIPYVRLMRKYPAFAKLAAHPTRWFAEDIAYRMGVLAKPNVKGWVMREVFFRPICFGIGLFAKARDWQALWRDGVTPSGVRS
jgi:hypothetical protein